MFLVQWKLAYRFLILSELNIFVTQDDEEELLEENSDGENMDWIQNNEIGRNNY